LPPEPLGLGIDLGSSGLRLALADRRGARIAEIACQYPSPFNDPLGWRQGLIALAAQLTGEQRKQVGAIAIDGTSGTLLLCRPDGSLAPGPLGQALPYHQACPEQREEAATIACSGPAASSSGSLARALALLAAAERAGESGPWLLRHQADWLMGWLLNCWRWGEEGNNLRLGWDLQRQCWQGAIGQQSWAGGLPEIIDSGRIVGPLAHGAAAALGLAEGCQVVAGSTDANAGVLAANPAMGDGISVLGTTLVLKQWAPQPISAPGVSSHRLGGRWLAGGAANAGAGVLRQFFNDAQLAELSRQIDPRQASGLDLRPLPGRGERFPIDDPELEPVLGPRPVSDARFLQGLLEGLARHEAAGWARLQELGAPPVRRVISLGGGARNPQWRSIRERLLGVPVLNRPKLSAALGMARLAAAALPHP
jgi:sugar (pentulose or hexulose) kinase